ncbi:MAG: endonuclease Q family protein [Candidatus Aenigmarchaeota archaeon]|nr:endonuclease Q family protein [Candidatus Aenigmarchaeota archaeon]
MKVVMDAHIHSRFSRATSGNITISNLERYGRMKGVNLIGTGDFTHPTWLSELKENLIEDGSGILKTKTGFNFILTAEISNIYVQDGKQRRVHNIILSPSFDVVEQINSELLKHGRLDYDGRPIFGFTCSELVEMIMSICRECMIIPAHILTPWFSIFGSKSGFDSVEECFKDQTKHIHALETGLSSNPAMNWRVSSLDKYTLVSFSDAHSCNPWRLGRENCVLDVNKLTYKEITDTIKKKEKGFLFTTEFFPQEGKYFFDGHRNCNVSLHPKESIKMNNFCPVCKRKLTVGVLHRIEELADRPEGFVPKNVIPFKSLIPLSELIKTILRIDTIYSKTVWEEYNKLIKEFKNELNVLLDVPKEELMKVTYEKVADTIIKVREGEVKYIAGYDGVYGKPVFDEEEFKKREEKQKDVKIHTQKRLIDF